MPRSLGPRIAALAHEIIDVRDIGLRVKPDEEVFAAALAADALIITRDRGFTYERGWPEGFTAGIIFINLPEDTPASEVTEKVVHLLSQRLPVSLLGAVTFLESHRALSRIVRRRP